MAAISAVLNPASVHNKPDERRVFIYSGSLKRSTLSLEQRFVDGTSTAAKDDSKSATALSPVIRNPSSLVSLLYDDILHVYGVTQPDSNLTLLSPVILTPMDKKKVIVANGFIAGCYDSIAKKAFIYYQSVEGTSNVLGRVDVTTGGAAYTKFPIKLRDKSWLAAFFDGQRQWVIHYNNNDSLAVFNLTGNADYEAFSSKVKGDPDATVAAAFVSSKEVEKHAGTELPGLTAGSLGRGFVYFVSKVPGTEDHELHRAYADLESNVPKPSFKANVLVSGTSIDVNPQAQMTVVVDYVQQCNWIYTLIKGDESVNSFRDNWSHVQETPSE